MLHPLSHIEHPKHLLLGRCGDGRQTRRNEVGQLARVGDTAGQRLQIVRQQRRQRNHLLKVVLDVALQRVDLESVILAHLFLGSTDPRLDIRLGLVHLVEMQTRLPLYNETQGAVRQLEHLVDVSCRADRIEICLRRLLNSRLELSEYADDPVVGNRLLDQANGTLSSHRQWHEGIRKQDGIAQRQDRQLGWDRDRPLHARDLLIEELVLIAHCATLLLATLPLIPCCAASPGRTFRGPAMRGLAALSLHYLDTIRTHPDRSSTASDDLRPALPGGASPLQ